MTSPKHVYDPGDMAAMAAGVTNIDRRTCKRTAPLRVICLGPSRSGTTSLRQALVDLGYNDCYHFAAALQENPPDVDMWNEAMDAKWLGKGKPFTRSDWDQLLGHCQATTDTPSVVFYKELLEAYPEAKVILTKRDNADQWHKSMMNTIVPYFEQASLPPRTLWGRLQRKYFSPLDAKVYHFCNLLCESPMYSALLYDRVHGTGTAKRWYEDYLAEIERIVPKDNLLVFNVKEGWEPLCEYLGHDVPAEPFPRRNDTMTFHKNLLSEEGMMSFVNGTIEQNTRQALMKAAGVLAVAAVLVGFVLQRRLA